ncbi:hypothetical protein Z043_106797 [Scleropages formosus]|uniref:Uncharacterized protein n=1 Tax=Scleropages formosus TaxID=113540 RepID=A0A0P7UZD1_SCLFO|nr:hypothetical protein Z043_106797 [Scleropages formosus]
MLSSQRRFRLMQDAVSQVVFDLAKCPHVSPLPVSLHWFPIAAHIKFSQALVMANKTGFALILPP